MVAMTGAVPSVFHYGRPPYRLGLARNKKREINTPPMFCGLLFLSFGGVRALEARGGSVPFRIAGIDATSKIIIAFLYNFFGK